MGILGKLFGFSQETDDEREIRLYNEEKSIPHRVMETAAEINAPVCSDGAEARFIIEDVFFITGRGTVVTGKVAEGSFSVGDKVTVAGGHSVETVITGIEQFRKHLDTVHKGDNAGILLRGVQKNQIARGDFIIK